MFANITSVILNHQVVSCILLPQYTFVTPSISFAKLHIFYHITTINFVTLQL